MLQTPLPSLGSLRLLLQVFQTILATGFRTGSLHPGSDGGPRGFCLNTLPSSREHFDRDPRGGVGAPPSPFALGIRIDTFTLVTDLDQDGDKTPDLP